MNELIQSNYKLNVNLIKLIFKIIFLLLHISLLKNNIHLQQTNLMHFKHNFQSNYEHNNIIQQFNLILINMKHKLESHQNIMDLILLLSMTNHKQMQYHNYNMLSLL
jgi:hypothetical protein